MMLFAELLLPQASDQAYSWMLNGFCLAPYWCYQDRQNIPLLSSIPFANMLDGGLN